MKNVLTNLNSHKLYKWIEENMASAQSCTAKELAESATAELGFEITENNMDNARRESGIVMRPVEVVDEDTTNADIKTLARGIVELFGARGWNIPPKFLFIINR